MDKNLINKFGFSELYEWKTPPTDISRFGRFVQFDKREADKIVLATDPSQIIGITTINSVVDSDDPAEWHDKNASNEYGDVYLRKERLAVGTKVYDQFEEMSYINTRAWEHLIPIETEEYDKSKQYIERSSRGEWVRVNLLGKVIVEDNGECVAGSWCTLIKTDDAERIGTAVPATENSVVKYYVLRRVSEKTILILNK